MDLSGNFIWSFSIIFSQQSDRETPPEVPFYYFNLIKEIKIEINPIENP